MKILELKEEKLEIVPKNRIEDAAKFYSSMKYGGLTRCRRFCANSHLVVYCRVDNKIVGAIRATSDEVRFAYLIDLFVNPKYRKKGIGSSLLRSTCKYYGEMKVDYIELDTDPDDLGLNEFYKKCGLEEEKKSKVFYWKYKNNIKNE